MSGKPANNHTQNQKEVESFSYFGSVVEQKVPVIEVKRKKLAIVQDLRSKSS